MDFSFFRSFWSGVVKFIRGASSHDIVVLLKMAFLVFVAILVIFTDYAGWILLLQSLTLW